MNKQNAIDDAQKKANLTKQPQVVFTYTDEAAYTSGKHGVEYNYTPQNLWNARRQRIPPATIVTTVKPITTVTD